MLETMGQQTAGMKKQAKELIEQAYQRGYREGYSKAENDYHAKTEEDRQSSYELGLNMAWEAARKIAIENTVPFEEWDLLKIGNSTLAVFNKYSASEAIEKIREYEEKKKHEEDSEIKVGDEVCSIYGEMIGIVTHIYSTTTAFNILWEDGGVGKGKNKSDFRKTGRTFPQIVEVLNKMREE